MAIMVLKIMAAIVGVTSRYLTLNLQFSDLDSRPGSALLANQPTFGNSCKIPTKIYPQGRFECDLEMGAKFRTHNDPSPVRIVLTTTPFFLIQTPFALIKIRSALIKTPFALTTT